MSKEKLGSRGELLQWSRFELKYLLDEATARSVSAYVAPLLEQDRYSQRAKDGFYPISSLYLDDDQFLLCRESLEGKKNRFKLRVRCYSDEPNSPAFLEIKRRMNSVITKSRSVLDRQQVPGLLAGKTPGASVANAESLRQFQYYARRMDAQPKVLISYWRKAYEGTCDNRVRVTLDRDLHFRTTSQPELGFSGPSWRSNFLRGVILEIKFNNTYPAWLGEMVRCFSLRSRSVSKYTISMRQSWLLGFDQPGLVQSGLPQSTFSQTCYGGSNHGH